MHRVDFVDTLHDGPRCFRRNQAHLDMDPSNDQHTVFRLHLTGNLSRQPTFTGIDVARFQRTSKRT